MLLTQQEMKQAAGEYAVDLIKSGTVIGIGTGSTVYYFIQALAKKAKAGLMVEAVATSAKTEKLAKDLGIPMIDLNDAPLLDIVIDGADEISPVLQLIKGGGGALLQEKMVAAASRKLVVIADAGKQVATLGKFPLPVEVIPYGWKQTARHISRLGCEPVLRLVDNKAKVTDHHHYILDCPFKEINDPVTLTRQLNAIPGVVENGLFIDMAAAAIISKPDGTIQVIEK